MVSQYPPQPPMGRPPYGAGGGWQGTPPPGGPPGGMYPPPPGAGQPMPGPYPPPYPQGGAPAGPPGQYPPPPPPGWGPHAPQPYLPHPGARQRRRSGAGSVIGGLIGLISLVFVGLAVLGSLLEEEPGSVTPISMPTETYSPTRDAYSPEPYSPTPETGSATPTSAVRSSPATTPAQRARLDRSLTNNTLYRAGALPKTNCRAGNANIYNHAQLKALILKTSRCMDRAWSTALKRVGMPWYRPGYAIVQTRGRGACGDYPARGSNVPYYCPANSTIYASTSAVAREYGPLGSWHGFIVSLMAHEYGHHVQNLSGILHERWRRHLSTSSQSQRLLLSRQLELQATCMAGMFMRSVEASYPITPARRSALLNAYNYLGDNPRGPRDHGSTRSNYAWFRQGYVRQKAYQCNTWVMPASTVS